MKKLVLMMVIFVVFTGCQKDPIDDLEKMGLTKDVISIQQTSEDVIGREILRDVFCNGISLQPNVTIDFDEDGFRTKESNYEYGEKVSETLYEYDKNNVLKVIEFNSFVGGYSFKQACETEDDEVIINELVSKGDLTLVFDDAIYNFNFTHTYNKNMDLILAKTYSETHQEIQKMTYEYNSDGRIIRFAGFNGEAIDFEVIVDYDGKLSNQYEFKSDIETYVYELDYEYDSKGNWNKMKGYYEGALLFTVTRVYTYK